MTSASLIWETGARQRPVRKKKLVSGRPSGLSHRWTWTGTGGDLVKDEGPCALSSRHGVSEGRRVPSHLKGHLA